MPNRDTRGRRGFTLIELLVVILIVALISAVALPVVLPALNERRVSEAARQLQAVLGGVRDAAIRANAPRGLRLLPDPILSPNATSPGSPGSVLAYNRMIPIEPAPDHSAGQVKIASTFPNLSALNDPQPTITTHFNNIYPNASPTSVQVKMLVLREVIYSDEGSIPATPLVGTHLSEPTAWYWNIRQGDKVRFGDSGQYYTIAGPMQIGPIPDPKSTTGGDPNAPLYANTDRFVNNGLPNTHAPSVRATNNGAEILFVLNGLDDDGDGYIDEAFDGLDNDGDGIIDPMFNGLDDDGDGVVDNEMTPGEYEEESFAGSQSSPFGDLTAFLSYTITRRPVVSPGAREISLPAGVVIDATTWNAPMTGPGLQPERSRLPVDPYTNYVDILVAPSGQVVQGGPGAASGAYNAGAPQASQPFYHFWITEREGVQPPLWGVSANPQTVRYSDQINQVPLPNPNATSLTATPQFYLLPMPKGTANYLPMPTPASPYTTSPIYLTGQRRLVTLFLKSGQIVTNSIEMFNAYDTNQPFYDAQSGVKESQ